MGCPNPGADLELEGLGLTCMQLCPREPFVLAQLQHQLQRMEVGESESRPRGACWRVIWGGASRSPVPCRGVSLQPCPAVSASADTLF